MGHPPKYQRETKSPGFPCNYIEIESQASSHKARLYSTKWFFQESGFSPSGETAADPLGSPVPLAHRQEASTHQRKKRLNSRGFHLRSRE